MIYIAIVIVTILLTSLVMHIVYSKQSIGDLVLTKDPDTGEDYIFLKLSCSNMDELRTMKRVEMIVSQK